jgi:hypothetical protein
MARLDKNRHPANNRQDKSTGRQPLARGAAERQNRRAAGGVAQLIPITQTLRRSRLLRRQENGPSHSATGPLALC